jgi:5-methylcytosine-specific restriction endonuclease McrA
MASASAGRRGRPWRRFQALVHSTYPPVCWLCGKAIAHGRYHPRHPLAPSVDHVVPLSRGGEPLDLDNARPAHYGCNASKGANPKITRMPTSQRW